MIRRHRLIIGMIAAATAAPCLADDPPKTMSQYVHMRIQDGSIVADVVPPPQDPTRPAAAATTEVVTLANVQGDVRILRRPTGMSASVTSPDRTLSLSITPTIMSLTRSLVDRTTGGTSRITFSQRTPAATAVNAAQINRVTLSITEPVPDQPGVSRVLATLSEPTFADMCAKHPEEVRQYLAPLFNDVGLHGLFGVTLDEARPLFAGMKLPGEAALDDEEMHAQVKAIIARLSSDSWQTRKAATNELLALGPKAEPVLKDLDLAKLPVETRAAVKTVLAMNEDFRLMDPDFLLLCVGLDDPRIPRLAAQRYEKLTGKKVPIDLSQPAPERAAQIEKLRMGA